MRKIKRGKSKKAQQLFGMSFSFIISVLLIAVFIAVAFFAIKHFLNIKKCNELGLFIDDLESEVENARNADYSEKTFTRSLPSGIEKVCFIDFSVGGTGIYDELKKNADFTANLYFYPPKKACIKSTNIQNINLTATTENKNPYCIDAEGKVRLKIAARYGDVKIIAP